MCGLAGFLGGGAQHDAAGEESLLRRMAEAIARRGPDDSGYWCDTSERIGLGHRRLAIVDLTAAGHQPMLSADGRYAIVFNGEIYNHMALRQALEQEGLVLPGVDIRIPRHCWLALTHGAWRARSSASSACSRWLSGIDKPGR